MFHQFANHGPCTERVLELELYRLEWLYEICNGARFKCCAYPNVALWPNVTEPHLSSATIANRMLNVPRRILAFIAVMASIESVTATKLHKIDVHAHYVPDFYAKALREAGHNPGPDGMPGIPVRIIISDLPIIMC